MLPADNHSDGTLESALADPRRLEQALLGDGQFEDELSQITTTLMGADSRRPTAAAAEPAYLKKALARQLTPPRSRTATVGAMPPPEPWVPMPFSTSLLAPDTRAAHMRSWTVPDAERDLWDGAMAGLPQIPPRPAQALLPANALRVHARAASLPGLPAAQAVRPPLDWAAAALGLSSTIAVVTAAAAAAGAVETVGPITPSRRPSRAIDRQNSTSSPGTSSGRAAARKKPISRLHHCWYPGCDKAFGSKSHRERHERCHTNERRFSCPIANCASRFNREDNMMQHYRVHQRRLAEAYNS